MQGAPPQKAQAEDSSSNIIIVPKSIHDVDNGKILGFGADLAEDHPVSCWLKHNTAAAGSYFGTLSSQQQQAAAGGQCPTMAA